MEKIGRYQWSQASKKENNLSQSDRKLWILWVSSCKQHLQLTIGLYSTAESIGVWGFTFSLVFFAHVHCSTSEKAETIWDKSRLFSDHKVFFSNWIWHCGFKTTKLNSFFHRRSQFLHHQAVTPLWHPWQRPSASEPAAKLWPGSDGRWFDQHDSREIQRPHDIDFYPMYPVKLVSH